MNSFIMFRSFLTGMKNLDDHSWRQMVEAIASYSMDGIEPDLPDNLVMAFEFARPNIDKAKSVRERGSKGGSSSKMQANENSLQANSVCLQANEISLQANSDSLQATYLEDKDKDKDIDKEMDKDMEMERESEGRPSAPSSSPRHRYGQYKNVLLSDQDLEKLKKEFPFDWQERIDRVDAYVQMHGKPYKDYLATIRAWARKDQERAPETKARTGPLNNFSETGYQNDDYARILEGNRRRLEERVANIGK